MVVIEVEIELTLLVVEVAATASGPLCEAPVSEMAPAKADAVEPLKVTTTG
jgi:hypothetical protein